MLVCFFLFGDFWVCPRKTRKGTNEYFKSGRERKRHIIHVCTLDRCASFLSTSYVAHLIELPIGCPKKTGQPVTRTNRANLTVFKCNKKKRGRKK